MENYVNAYEKENRKIQILFVIRFIPVFKLNLSYIVEEYLRYIEYN